MKVFLLFSRNVITGHETLLGVFQTIDGIARAHREYKPTNAEILSGFSSFTGIIVDRSEMTEILF